MWVVKLVKVINRNLGKQGIDFSHRYHHPSCMNASKQNITYRGGLVNRLMCFFCNCRLEAQYYVYFVGNSESGYLWCELVISNKTFFPFIFISPRLLQHWYIFYAVRWNMNMIRSVRNVAWETLESPLFLKLKSKLNLLWIMCASRKELGCISFS